MPLENQQSDCPNLISQLNQLNTLRIQFAAETEEFQKNPHYERESFQVMMERMEEIESKFRDIYNNISELHLNIPLEIRKALSNDYQEDLKTMADFYHLIEEDPEKPGRYFYAADYDGKQEPADKWEKVEKTYTMPSLSEIFKMLTLEQIKLYQEMQKEGLEPRLQLTPIALNLRTLAAKLDDKKDQINEVAGKEFVTENTFINDENDNESGAIDEIKMIYEPQTVEASASGNQLILGKGLTKSQLIKKYQGWLVSIVAMKSEIELDPDECFGDDEFHLTNAQKMVLYMRKAHQKGESGLGYEDYFMAQMNALAGNPPHPLDAKKWTILPESCLLNTKRIAFGYWCGSYLYLCDFDSQNKFDFLRLRRSIRLKY